MKITICAGMILAVAVAAQAQTFDDLQVIVQGLSVRPAGGEQVNVFMSTGPIVIGKTTPSVFALTECGNFGVSGGRIIVDDPVDVWRVEVTPTRVEGRAVTFRLKWVRARDNRKDVSGPGVETELTLRRGESVPIDIVPVSPTVKPAGEFCEARAASIRVKAENFPLAQDSRRLIAFDLWLVERLPDGTERSQPMSVRGLANEAAAFYFDTISDGSVALDFFGELTANARNGVVDVRIDARSRLVENGQVNRDSNALRDGSRYRSRSVDADLRLKPDEVVAVELPRLGENEAGAFANRKYSIRVRARQLR